MKPQDRSPVHPTVASAADKADFVCLDQESAAAFAQLALKGIDREYPNKPGEVLRGAADLLSPRAMHPAFYGCYDWHSAVHGHWLLVRLLRFFPDMAGVADVRTRLAAHLTAENLAEEAAYFAPKENRSFERMYGWAWALRLAAELRVWDDSNARQWAKSIEPLERALVRLTKEFLPKLTYPVRSGVHQDTGFALGQMLDYARTIDDRGLEDTITARARAFYLADRDYPIGYEPSGEDFFSSGLNEADLMRRVLAPAEFSAWLDRFVPGLRAGQPVRPAQGSERAEGLANWAGAVLVNDLSDGRIGHLAGLNLSRAWTLRGVLSALAADDPCRSTLAAAVRVHETEGLRYVFSGHYEGEHWLATFAVYQLTNAGLESQRTR